MYNILLTETNLQTLLTITKNDFTQAYEQACDDPYDCDDAVKAMKEDIDLLEAIEHVFKNDDAKLKFQTILSGYRRKLREFEQ